MMIGLNVASKRVRSGKARRALEIEPLEGRQLLATIHVNSFEDLPKPPPGTITLRSAIAMANSDREPDVIILPTGTYHALRTLTIVPDRRLSIVGQEGGAVIQEVVDPQVASGRAVNNTVFSVQRGARVMFENMAITLGEAHAENGNKAGGGLLNRGNLTLADCTVVNNAADVGGGIANEGHLRIIGSRITGNAATESGGGGLFNLGTLIIEESRIQDNRSFNFGGGLWDLGGSAKAIINLRTRIDGNAPNDLANTNGGSAELGSAVVIGGRF